MPTAPKRKSKRRMSHQFPPPSLKACFQARNTPIHRELPCPPRWKSTIPKLFLPPSFTVCFQASRTPTPSKLHRSRRYVMMSEEMSMVDHFQSQEFVPITLASLILIVQLNNFASLLDSFLERALAFQRAIFLILHGRCCLVGYVVGN